MSTFAPGTGGDLKSTNIPAALFESARLLDSAETLRNASNPGLTARRNLSTTVSFDTGTVTIAATLPVTVEISSTGISEITATDYLGSTYTDFTPGTGGTLKSTNCIAAFLETSTLLAAAEKAVTPAENQPNNIQISYDLETGNATVTANLPFTTEAATDGAVTVVATDYL